MFRPDPDRQKAAAVDALLARGCLTWLDASDFFDVAGHAGGTSLDGEAVQGHAVGRACSLVRALVGQQLVVAGDLVDSRHVPWAGDTSEAIAKVTGHWAAAGVAGLTDANVWFEPTAAGFSRGAGVLARDGLPASVREYDGHWVVRPDGIKVGLRHTSARGAKVIDVLHPDGTLEHVRTTSDSVHSTPAARRAELPAETKTELQTELDDLLARATDDWLWTAGVFDAARSCGGPDGDALIEHASMLLSAALTGGLLVPGRIAFGRFAPWTMSSAEAASRIAAHWRRRPYRLGDLDFSVWFAPTQAGLSRGEGVVARELGRGFG